MTDMLTLVLSVWGAVIGTILLVKEIADYRRDRAILWIRAAFGSVMRGDDFIGRGLSVRMVNRGRRVLIIREVRIILRQKHEKAKIKGITFMSDKFWLFPKPKDNIHSTISLEEGEQAHLSDWLNLKRYSDFSGARVELVTTTGKCFKARVIDLFENQSLGSDSWV